LENDLSLEGPWLTTTSTKKRVEKITKAKQEELERGWRDRNKRLKEMGLPKESLEQYKDWIYGRGKKETSKKIFSKTYPTTSAKKTAPRPKKLEVAILSSPATSRQVDNTKWLSVPDSVLGPCSSKPTTPYTGENILGIAVLHKSCLQPVFSQEEATDVARMRR
jgi:hypothetical protein